ncbi:efflux RND transporter permease subunit [Kineobactrum salinum]|uniref:efflux RND transporter permease subunit n=1 Tax=Kineobactrum salinum TaxID=2708301 RepID=UPI0022B299CB|nr:efflux RND transporter permease subunit [Kineobactrum salinum]
MYGEPEEEIRVALDEQALSARGLGVADVAAALRAADPRMAAGRSTGAGSDLLIEVAGAFDSMSRIRDVVLRAAADGSTVRLSDVARVYKSQRTPPASRALIQGDDGILVGVAMTDGLQVDRWSREFAAFVDRYRALAPQGVQLEISYDQSVYTRERLQGVLLNLAIGVVLVMAVLLLTMGWRAALVVAVVLPLCSLFSISVLYQLGEAIHQMSVTGLVVALGLLVDGSIVMTDEIRKRLTRGASPVAAIGGAVHRLRIPLLSSTATTVLAFMPMLIMPGPAGDFVGSIASAVVVMLVGSLLLALTVTPVLAAWLLPRGLEHSRHWWNRGLESGRAGRWLTHGLDWSLRNPVASIALALVLPLTGFLAYPTLTAQFFPGTDRDQLYLQVKLPDGRSIDDTTELVRRLDRQLRADPLIRRVDWSIGENAPAFYYNMLRTREGIPSWAEGLVLTTDPKQTDALIRRLQREVDAAFPEARIIVRGIEQGPPVMAPLEVELYGDNLEVLRQLGEQFRWRMERLPDVTHTNTSLVAGAPKLVFTADEHLLRLAGLQQRDLAAALDAALQGLAGGEVLEGTERLPVRVRLEEAAWGSAGDIAALHLPLPGAAATDRGIQGVALSSLGSFELVPAHSPITRSDGQRTNTVQAFLTRGVLPEETLIQLRRDLDANPLALPQGYSYAFGGDSNERAEVVDKILAPLGMIIALLVTTIVLTFNSWRLSLVALLVCVCSMGLSLLSLAIFRYPFGIQAMIGVIGSVGVSINAAIIIMTALQLDRDALAGGLYAVRQVVMDSSRHIVSTTITTFGGFLPLILEGGQFWPPFAMSIAGGVLLSTVVSFFLVPPLFVLVSRWGKPPVGAIPQAVPGAAHLIRRQQTDGQP